MNDKFAKLNRVLFICLSLCLLLPVSLTENAHAQTNQQKTTYAKELEAKAKAGNAEAMDKIGHCYYQGYGVAKDYAKAFYWYEQSANKGNASGQCSLGIMYFYGDGVNKDYNAAFKLFEQSATKNYAMGQHWLGHMYQYGFGVQKDENKAFKLYRSSLKNGNQKAQVPLEKLTRDLELEQIIKQRRKVADVVNDAAVLILTQFTQKDGNIIRKTVSGFFVAPGVVLTSRQALVKDDLPCYETIFIAMTDALLKKFPGNSWLSGKATHLGQDFVLITCEPMVKNEHPVLPFCLTTDNNELASIWGFPKSILRYDKYYDKLVTLYNSDLAPPVTARDGAIRKTPNGVLSYSAEVFPEDAGAPLLNKQGAVVGIIEWDEGKAKGVVTPAASAVKFMKEHGYKPTVVNKTAVRASCRTWSFEEKRADIEPGVVWINVDGYTAEGKWNGGSGSGFVVAPGYILTNSHVVGQDRIDKILVGNKTVGLFEARLVARTGATNVNDFALLKCEALAKKLPALIFCFDARRYDQVTIWGYPGASYTADGTVNGTYDHHKLGAPAVVNSAGIISHMQSYNDQIQIVCTVPILPGSSGGPLFNVRGEVVGIATGALQKDDTKKEDHIIEKDIAYFAMPASDILTFLQINGVQPRVRNN